MLIKILRNPYYTYIFVWVAVLLTYSLGWSTIAPKLPFGLIAFFAVTFLFSFMFGKKYAIKTRKSEKIFEKANLLRTKDSKYKPKWFILILIIIIYLIEFVDFGGIPFFLVLAKKPYEYATFGIKTVHVFVHTFSTYYAIYLANLFLKSNNKKFFFQVIVICFFHLLIFNRGSIVFIIVGMLLCYFQYVKKISLIKKIIMVILVLVGLYFFGLIGNIRSFGSDSNLILDLSFAKESFVNGIIPKEFFWFYSYFALPLGTFAHNIINNTVIISFSSLYDFFVMCIAPDFIASRLPTVINTYEMMQFLPYFNVGTIYVNGYITLGWIGVFIIFFYQIGVIKLVEKLIPYTSPNYVVAKSLIILIVIMNVFSGMLTFSGLILPLIYAILAEKLGRRKGKLNERNQMLNSHV